MEVMCQLPENTKRHQIAYALINGAREAHAVHDRGKPIGIFGISPMTPAMCSIWALGTKSFWRGVPAVTRFVKSVVVPVLIEDGYRTMEARSHVQHQEAHRWMTATGACQVDQPYIYGRNDEEFVTFRWTAADFAAKSRTLEPEP